MDCIYPQEINHFQYPAYCYTLSNFDEYIKQIRENSLIHRKNEFWSSLYKIIDDKYRHNSYLEKGTTLYRGSVNQDPYNFGNKSIIYYDDDGFPEDLEPELSCKKPCVHPQWILHSNKLLGLDELGTELTIP